MLCSHGCVAASARSLAYIQIFSKAWWLAIEHRALSDESTVISAVFNTSTGRMGHSSMMSQEDRVVVVISWVEWSK